MYKLGKLYSIVFLEYFCVFQHSRVTFEKRIDEFHSDYLTTSSSQNKGLLYLTYKDTVAVQRQATSTEHLHA